MAELNFDASQVAPDSGPVEPIPAAWYNAIMDESELKPTKDGQGAYLQCRFNIIDGDYVNRKVFIRLNLQNANPVAQEIAYRQLSAIAHAVNVLNVRDSSQLHGLPMKIKVKVREASGGYEATNEISGYKPLDNTLPQQTAPAQQAPVANTNPAPVTTHTQPPQQQQPPQWQPPQTPQPWEQNANQPPATPPQQSAPPPQQTPPTTPPPVAPPNDTPPTESVPPWLQNQQASTTPPWSN